MRSRNGFLTGALVTQPPARRPTHISFFPRSNISRPHHNATTFTTVSINIWRWWWHRSTYEKRQCFTCGGGGCLSKPSATSRHFSVHFLIVVLFISTTKGDVHQFSFLFSSLRLNWKHGPDSTVLFCVFKGLALPKISSFKTFSPPTRKSRRLYCYDRPLEPVFINI